MEQKRKRWQKERWKKRCVVLWKLLRFIDRSVSLSEPGQVREHQRHGRDYFSHSPPAPRCNQTPCASTCLTANAKFSVISWRLPSELALVYTYTLDVVKQAWFNQCCISNHLAGGKYVLEYRWEKKKSLAKFLEILLEFIAGMTFDRQPRATCNWRLNTLLKDPTWHYQNYWSESTHPLWIIQSAAQHFGKYLLSKTTSYTN